MPAPKYYLQFKTANDNVAALLDETTPTVTDGYGGWKEVDRARRTSYVDWPGKPALKMTVGIVFDGLKEDFGVMPQVKRLEAMALPGDGVTKPPIVKLYGFVPHTDLSWVISSIAWGESMRNDKGELVRQKMSVTLWQFVPADIVTKSPASTAKAKAKTKTTQEKGKSTRSFTASKHSYQPDPTANATATTIYTTHVGETLDGIAARELGDWQRWKELSDLNNVVVPFLPLPFGQRLKVPVN
jgi:hypothetical protein